MSAAEYGISRMFSFAGFEKSDNTKKDCGDILSKACFVKSRLQDDEKR